MFNLSLYINTSKNYSVCTSGESCPEVSCKKCVLKNFAKFTEKHLCRSLFFNKVARGPQFILKKETLAQVFCCEFCGILKNTFFIEHLWWLLLYFTDIEGRCLNKFGKYLSCRGVFRTHTNNWVWEVCRNSGLEWLTIVAKTSILDVWKSCGYASQLDK